jgi:hypothetical protein
MANSFSNAFTIYLALYGGWTAIQQSLPLRFLLGFTVRFSAWHIRSRELIRRKGCCISRDRQLRVSCYTTIRGTISG